jgi:hypothetical protein
LHGPLKKNNKNSGKKIKFGPPPPGPLGGDFRFLKFFLENIRRRSVTVPKLHRGFILTKKGYINPQKKFGDPPAPWGGILGSFRKISKVVLWF